MRSGWFLLAVLALVGVALAAITYVGPAPYSSRTDWMTNRYTTPVEGLLAVDVVTPDVNDSSTSLDANLCGYLQRVVFAGDGNDGAWSLTLSDAAGATVFARTDCNMVNDPCSYVCDYGPGGIPFAGGLTVAVADANDGDGNDIAIRLYVREAWRR